jgi:hypothetical protein
MNAENCTADNCDHLFCDICEQHKDIAQMQHMGTRLGFVDVCDACFAERPEGVADEARLFIIDGAGPVVTLDQLLASNDFDDAEVAEVRSLAMNDTFEVGGGAAASTVIKRVA